MAKQYGLSFPKEKGHKIGQVSFKRPSVFDNDSDSEEQPIKPTGVSQGIKKQDLLSQEKAVADDPTVFQYDEVYDEIERKRNESKLARKDLVKKPKYIGRLLVAAEKRKRDNDRRIERQVQKEREEEGDKFNDKESFITPSYKKKLEELRELEEQEKREEYLESIGDVRKQGNLDGFYRHLYDQKVNYEEKQDASETKAEVKKEELVECEVKEENESEEKNKKNSGDESIGEITKKVSRKRTYRSRKESQNNSDSEDEVEVKKEHLPSNIDADSDFSVDSSDSDEEEISKKEKIEDSTEKPPKEEAVSDKTDVKNVEPENKSTDDKIEDTTKNEEPKIKPKKIKVDIWKKRTVGEVFDEAVKRYFERKAIREMGQ